MSNHFVRIKLSACALTASLLVLFGAYATTTFAQDKETKPEEKAEKVDCTNPDNAGLEECEPNEEVVVEERYGYSDNENPREAEPTSEPDAAKGHGGGQTTDSTTTTTKPETGDRKDVESSTDDSSHDWFVPEECKDEKAEAKRIYTEWSAVFERVAQYESAVESIQDKIDRYNYQVKESYLTDKPASDYALSTILQQRLTAAEKGLAELRAEQANLYAQYSLAYQAYQDCFDDYIKELSPFKNWYIKY